MGGAAPPRVGNGQRAVPDSLSTYLLPPFPLALPRRPTRVCAAIESPSRQQTLKLQNTKQYLRDLECPHAWAWSQGAAGRLPALRWLLGKAVACDYEDGGKGYGGGVRGVWMCGFGIRGRDWLGDVCVILFSMSPCYARNHNHD